PEIFEMSRPSIVLAVPIVGCANSGWPLSRNAIVTPRPSNIGCSASHSPTPLSSAVYPLPRDSSGERKGSVEEPGTDGRIAGSTSAVHLDTKTLGTATRSGSHRRHGRQRA